MLKRWRRADTVASVPDPALERLGVLLVEAGHCEPAALERAGRVANETDQRLDTVLIQLGVVTERALANCYADMQGVALLPADGYPASPLVTEHLSSRFLRDARAVPVALDGDALVLAMANPLDRFTPHAVSAAIGRPVVKVVGLPIELEAALDRLYPTVETEDNAEPAIGVEGQQDDAERLKDLASEAPIIRLVNQLIARAVESHASDIHIEPLEDRLRVRLRYDGALVETDSQPARLAAALISRIKIMAHLDIAERRLPQDGRIRVAVRGQEVDCRVSTIPSLHGETVVLRVLDRGTVALDFVGLGLKPDLIDQLGAALSLPNGMILVTGPTGSGKTTTLYAGLRSINAEKQKIVTVEDPIEYQLVGINQIQTKPQIGLTFATLLRSILRQDPDVIMVGEIRDRETAEIAVQAALTGHLVLSTLHTNSAAAAITRLRDMGVEDYLLSAVLRGVLAQRLLRRLCVQCRRASVASAELVTRLSLRRLVADPDSPVMAWHAVGCPECRHTGYRGRLAIAEFLRPTAAIERQIFSRADHSEIERTAVAEGMEAMFEAGLRAAVAGETTIEEVVRSLRAEA